MKSAIRKQVRAERDNIGPLFRLEKSREIHEELHKLTEFTQAENILLYHSTQSEVETEEVIEQLLSEGKAVYLPRSEEGELIICRIQHKDDLAEGAYGIKEPKGSCLEYDPEKLDCLIIPGVAFDRKGNRLGYGKGYYDKLLKNCSAPKIALAFAEQIVDDVPAEPHDIAMDLIVTDQGLILP